MDFFKVEPWMCGKNRPSARCTPIENASPVHDIKTQAADVVNA